MFYYIQTHRIYNFSFHAQLQCDVEHFAHIENIFRIGGKNMANELPIFHRYPTTDMKVPKNSPYSEHRSRATRRNELLSTMYERIL